MNSGPDGITLRAASADDAGELSRLAFRSKAHWGYSPSFMESCRKELTYSGSEVVARDRTCTIAETSAGMAGFYILRQLGEQRYELDALFVEPSRSGEGIGRRLLNSARKLIALKGGGRLLIQSDPHAGAFYLACGAAAAGTRESDSIPGRMLPLFEIKVAAERTGTR